MTKEVKIYNKSMLPVAFHVTGIKELGDEFTLDNDHGVIAPGDSATVKLTVKSLRAFALKKSLRLEVCICTVLSFQLSIKWEHVLSSRHCVQLPCSALVPIVAIIDCVTVWLYC